MDAVRVALLREVLAGTEWLGATRRFGGVLRGSVVSHGGGLLLVGTPDYEPWHLAAHLVDEAAWSGTPELRPTLVRHGARPSDPAHLAVGPGRLAAVRRGETLLVVAPDVPDAPLLERVHDARRAGATVLTLGSGDRELTSLAHEALTVPGTADGSRSAGGTRATADPAAVADPAAGVVPADGEDPGNAGNAGGTMGAVGAVGAAVRGPEGAGSSAGTAGGGPAGAGAESGGSGGSGGADLDLDTVQHLVSAAAGENVLPAPRARRRFLDRLARLADQLSAPPPPRW